MSTQLNCPTRESWQSLLTGALPESDQTTLTQHLENCPTCQQAVQGLAASSSSWNDLPTFLAAPLAPRSTTLDLAIANLKAQDAGDETVAEIATADHTDLDFLDPPAQPGHLGRLHQYEIHSVVGRGGMGVVLKAFDEKMQRTVAIKVLAPQLATSATSRMRFTREAKAAAAVTHENVVVIHEVGEFKSIPYLAMEFVAGQTLQEKLDKAGPLEMKEILRIARQAAHGLAAAHEQGLIHRDIKPGNILLENGVERVKLTDFGLARAVDDASLTQSGVIAGTPMYMAPEQALCAPLDHRADLFSLGSVLYVMCTGQSPFRAPGTMAVLKRVIEDTPRPIREINPEIPDWLADLVARLQAKKPQDRFTSAQELADCLGQHLAEVQFRGVGGSPARKPVQASRPHYGAIAAFLTLALVLAFVFWPRDRENPQNPEQKNSPQPIVPLPVKEEWAQLFNGKDFTGWTFSGKRRREDLFQIVREDGEPALLVKEGAGGLSSAQTFDNFHLKMEYKVSSDETALGKLVCYHQTADEANAALIGAGNSGGMVSWANRQFDEGAITSSGIAFRAPGKNSNTLEAHVKADRPVGAWNVLEIISLGGSAIHVVNGQGAAVGFNFRTKRPGETPIVSGKLSLRALARGEVFLRKITLRPITTLPEHVVPKEAVPAQTAFALLARDGRGEQRHSSLAAAASAAQSGDTIEIRGNGPFPFRGIHISKKALCIRAAEGSHPVLQFQLSDEDGTEEFLKTDAPLILEGLDFRAAKLAAKDKENVRSILVSARDAPLMIANCRFQSMGPAANVVPNGCRQVELRNSLLLGHCYHQLSIHPPKRGHLTIANNIIASRPVSHGSVELIVNPRGLPEKCLLTMERTTIWGARSSIEVRMHAKPVKPFVVDMPLKIHALHNVLAGSKADLILHQRNPAKDALTTAEYESFLKGLVAWKEQKNVQTAGLELWHNFRALLERDPQDALAHWQKSWDLGNTQSLVEQPRFALSRDDLHLRVGDKPQDCTPRDFQLAAGSPGKGAGPGGKDLGADVHFVGPGAAYSRWKKTPEYQAWRKRAELLTQSSEPPAVFVLLATGSRKEQSHTSLNAAASAAHAGDTIEIRSNGPLAIEPIHLRQKSLVLRAGDGFRPVLHPDPLFRDLEGALVSTTSLLVLEGLEIHTDAHLLDLSAESASLVARHCRLVSTADVLPINASAASQLDVRSTQIISPKGNIEDKGGPGAAYEAWKKTPEYQAWRKETQDRLSRAADQAQPFAILDRAGDVKERHGTLADASAAAQFGDTIEIRGDGPYQSEPINFGDKALWIKAGKDRRPVLRMTSTQTRLITRNTLVLEGLTLIHHQEGPQPPDSWPSLLQTSGPLHMAHCRLVNTGAGHLVSATARMVEIVNCDLRAMGKSSGIAFVPHYPATVLVKNCVLHSSDTAFLVETYKSQSQADIRFEKNTGVSGRTFFSFRYRDPAAFVNIDPLPPLRMELTHNIFASAAQLAQVQWRNQEEGAGLIATVEKTLRRAVKWEEKRNLYSPGGKFLTVYSDANKLPLVLASTFEDWNQYWSLKSTDTIIDKALFRGDGLVDRASKADPDLPLDSFRLEEGSPGQARAADGRNLGADVDLVGPGAAYERWKRMPEYQEWRERMERAVRGQ